MSDLTLAIGPDIVLLQRLPVAQAYPGADLFTHAFVGNAYDRNIFDCGMPTQKILDLARIDILAAAYHHILDAADNAPISGLIQNGDVAAVHPSVLINGCGRLSPQ